VFDRVTSRSRPAISHAAAPILALLALAALLTGCVIHDGRPAVYGYGYFGGYSGGYHDYDHRRDYGWRNRWHRGDGYYGHHHHRRYGRGYPNRYRHWR
jgi:hypothetical protein